MVTDQNRIGHAVQGKIYLADKGVEMSVYKGVVREAYGSLRGVKFHEFPKGTRLRACFTGDGWQLD